MQTIIENLAKLIKVKTFITAVVVLVFAVLVVRGDPVPESVMFIVTSVISFYFGTQHEKGGSGNDHT